jgi:transposase
LLAQLLYPDPGVARETAENFVAEISTDMSRFPSANQTSSWAGMASGNNETAEKKYSGKSKKGNKPLGVILTQAAHAAVRKKIPTFRPNIIVWQEKGVKKRVLNAVAYTILVIAYFMIENQMPHQELGSDYFDKRRPETTAKRLVSRLEHLGYQVSLRKSLSRSRYDLFLDQ